jgi:hypothetical protein
MIIALFAITAIGGAIFAFIWLSGAPPRGIEGSWGLQIMMFTAPGAGLAIGGGGALIGGVVAVRRGDFAGAAAKAALALLIAGLLLGYYGTLSVQEFLLAFRAIPEPADPFFISRRIAPLVALVLGSAAALWAYLGARRRNGTAAGDGGIDSPAPPS